MNDKTRKLRDHARENAAHKLEQTASLVRLNCYQSAREELTTALSDLNQAEASHDILFYEALGLSFNDIAEAEKRCK